jgi:hypothetical protein
MKKLLVLALIFLSIDGRAQIGEKFKKGFIVDKSGDKYEGLIRLEPGNEKNPGALIFKEEKKGKKETYGPTYIKSFKIESDSFTVLKKIPMPKKKVREADFAKVLLVGSGGAIYELEYIVEKSTGHAATEYRISEQNSKYYIQVNGKTAMLTPSNFKDVAVVVADCPELKSRIAAKKVKFADLEKVVSDYKNCTPQAGTKR